MGKFMKWAKIILVVTISSGVGFTLAGFLLRDWDFSGWQFTQPIATIIASIIGLTAAWIALHNGQKTREQDKEIYEAKSRAEQERALRERFTSIIELLATDDLTKRESGAYALAALADDWATFYKNDKQVAKNEEQTCLNILVGQLRDEIQIKKNATPTNSDLADFKKRIQSLIFKRFHNIEMSKAGHWSELELNLSNCHMFELEVTGTFSNNVSFHQCTFHGRTEIRDATFTKLSFSDTKFFQPITISNSTYSKKIMFNQTVSQESFNFTQCNLKDGANFYQTYFNSSTTFQEIQSSQPIEFIRTNFGNSTEKIQKYEESIFANCKFSGTIFYKIIFNNKMIISQCNLGNVTQFHGITFKQQTVFRKLQLENAVTIVNISAKKKILFRRCHIGSGVIFPDISQDLTQFVFENTHFSRSCKSFEKLKEGGAIFIDADYKIENKAG